MGVTPTPAGDLEKATPPLARLIINLMKRGATVVTVSPTWHPISQGAMSSTSERAPEASSAKDKPNGLRGLTKRDGFWGWDFLLLPHHLNVAPAYSTALQRQQTDLRNGVTHMAPSPISRERRDITCMPIWEGLSEKPRPWVIPGIG